MITAAGQMARRLQAAPDEPREGHRNPRGQDVQERHASADRHQGEVRVHVNRFLQGPRSE